jgi:aminomethyltransferase
MAEEGALRRSPLFAHHRDLGAKLVDFGGWEMPLSYPRGTLAEHLACRRAAAVFDVSHLGTVRVEGPGAFERLQRTFTNDLAKVAPGRTQYTHLLAEDGSVLDDLIVWWTDHEVFEVMPNASNTARVQAAVGGRDVTDTRAVLAVQGPRARAVLARVSAGAAEVGRSWVGVVGWDGVELTVAGTGYTGEDGVEIAVPAEHAPALWRALLEAGATPAGLGARDTLRLEAGLPLYGHELGPGITPLQAGLSWVVAWDKPTFLGKEALLAERRRGVRRRLRGVRAEGRRPPRQGAAVVASGARVGEVTSGNFSPLLGVGIGMALIDTAAALASGQLVTVVERGHELTCQLCRLPFYTRQEPDHA